MSAEASRNHLRETGVKTTVASMPIESHDHVIS